MHRTCVRLAWVVVPGFLAAITGCPTDDTAIDWPSVQVNATSFSVEPAAVRVADMDGDENKDVVSLWLGGTATDSPLGGVAIHFQEADGSFIDVLAAQDAHFSNAYAIAIADVTNDGHPDVIVANDAQITIVYPTGDPRVAANWEFFDLSKSIDSTYKHWLDVAVADIDDKNGLDIVATLNDPGHLVWFESPADPTSAHWDKHSIDSTTRKGADSLLLTDVDGNGKTDVVCSATGDTNGVISWYERKRTVTDPWTKHVMSTFSGASRLGMGDVDGDGTVDLVAISASKRQVAWFPRPATITGVWNGWVLANYTKYTNDTRIPDDVTLADMNNDDLLDVVVETSEPAGLFWYTPKADTKASWAENRIAAVANISFSLFAVDDLDDNGWVDVVAPVTRTDDPTLDRIVWYQNQGQ